MRKQRVLSLAASSIFLLALWGCGSNMDSSSADTPSVSIKDAAKTGNCTVCHTVGVHTQVSGVAGQNKDALGLGSAITHDCEACHGGGQYHHGEGPLPYPSPDATRCETCHAYTTKVQSGKHNIGSTTHSGTCGRCHSMEGNYAFDAGTENYGAVSTTPYNGTSNVSCSACHETLAANLSSGSPTLRTPRGWNIGSAQFNLCTSCHNLVNETGVPIASGNTVSGTITVAKQQHGKDWYRNITSTHYDLTTTGVSGTTDANILAGDKSTVEGYVVRKNSATACTECHGHEFYTNTNGVSSATPTSDTIHTQWAKSAHAGGLLKAKIEKHAALSYVRTTANAAAIMAVGATDSPIGNAWTHYNWDRTGRASCQRCHTATGASNFLKNPAGYVAANNNFDHLVGWTGNAANGSNQNELLYCWGCHSSVETGALHTPGAITEIYSAATTGDPTTTVSYPDAGASNVCMGCHLGREVGQVVKNDQDADGVRSFINSHYLAAGATLFNESGYEYTGKNYADPAYFAHNKIGLSTPVAATDRGPCASCHMGTGKASHTFEVVEKNSTDVIVSINSDVCVTCHTGAYALTAAGLEAEKEEYHAALAALEAALDAKGIYFYPAHPYFYKDANANGTFDLGEDVNRNGVLDAGEDVNSNGVFDLGFDVATATKVAFTDWASVYGLPYWKDTMGAAFNYNLLEHDPGGYAHNRYYVKRLIFDAIDFIDDGTLDGTISVSVEAAAYLDGDAATIGVQRP